MEEKKTQNICIVCATDCQDTTLRSVLEELKQDMTSTKDC